MPLALFDLDDTLLDRTTAFRDWVRWLAGRHGLDPAVATAWFCGVDDDGALRLPQLAELARIRFELRATVPELVAAHDETIHRFFRLDESVATALRRLRADGWRIGIVTNGRLVQERVIVATGLHELVDGWAISAAEGVAKPDRSLFELAARRAGATLADAWMVGDSPDDDIVAANDLGLTSVWVHRNRAWPYGGDHPDHIVASVADAATLALDPDLFLPGDVGIPLLP